MMELDYILPVGELSGAPIFTPPLQLLKNQCNTYVFGDGNFPATA